MTVTIKAMLGGENFRSTESRPELTVLVLLVIGHTKDG